VGVQKEDWRAVVPNHQENTHILSYAKGIKNNELGTVSFEVKLPSACSFIVDGLAFCCRCSHSAAGC
jgi:hypothetical protein